MIMAGRIAPGFFFCPFVCFVSVQTSSGRGGKFVYFCWKKAAVVAAKT
jgi:hypothetical protein